MPEFIRCRSSLSRPLFYSIHYILQAAFCHFIALNLETTLSYHLQVRPRFDLPNSAELSASRKLLFIRCNLRSWFLVSSIPYHLYTPNHGVLTKDIIPFIRSSHITVLYRTWVSSSRGCWSTSTATQRARSLRSWFSSVMDCQRACSQRSSVLRYPRFYRPASMLFNIHSYPISLQLRIMSRILIQCFHSTSQEPFKVEAWPIVQKAYLPAPANMSYVSSRPVCGLSIRNGSRGHIASTVLCNAHAFTCQP